MWLSPFSEILRSIDYGNISLQRPNMILGGNTFPEMPMAFLLSMSRAQRRSSNGLQPVKYPNAGSLTYCHSRLSPCPCADLKMSAQSLLNFYLLAIYFTNPVGPVCIERDRTEKVEGETSRRQLANLGCYCVKGGNSFA